MAFIGQTRGNYSDEWKDKVCLSEEECMLLLPVVRRLKRRKVKMAEYYEDIHEGGEATSRQDTALMKAQEAADVLSNIEEVMNRFCNTESR